MKLDEENQLTPEQIDQLLTEAGKGMQARRILDDPLFTGAYEAMEKQIINAWSYSKLEDSSVREALYHRMRNLIELKGRLQVHFETGKLAEEGLKKTEAKGIGQKIREYFRL